MSFVFPGNLPSTAGIQYFVRYWSILLAKLVVGAAVLYAIWIGLHSWYEAPTYLARLKQQPFTHDLKWTTVLFFYNLLCNAVLVLIILDQKYRCRTCGRRLRMPITTGNHAQVLFGPPKTEYICLYGHGTLKVPELNLSGTEPSDWKQNEDIWTELSGPARQGRDFNR